MYFWIARWIFLLWDALLIAWAVSLMTSQPAIQTQNSESRIAQIAIQVFGMWMIFGSPFLLRRTILADRILPTRASIALLGLSFTVLGMLWAAYARITLGRNWNPSGREGVMISRRGHRFIRRGPYRLARHPIYAGLIFAVLGTAIVYVRLECFAGALLVAIGLWFKLRSEEKFMLAHFSEDYARYQSEVRALIPFVY